MKKVANDYLTVTVVVVWQLILDIYINSDII